MDSFYRHQYFFWKMEELRYLTVVDVVLFAYNFCQNRRNFLKQTKISAYIVVNSFREIIFCYRLLIYILKRELIVIQ